MVQIKIWIIFYSSSLYKWLVPFWTNPKNDFALTPQYWTHVRSCFFISVIESSGFSGFIRLKFKKRA